MEVRWLGSIKLCLKLNKSLEVRWGSIELCLKLNKPLEHQKSHLAVDMYIPDYILYVLAS